MDKLPPEAQAAFSDMSAVKMLATISPDYKVNLVPVASLNAMGDDTLLFVHLFLKKTKVNLGSNPNVVAAVFQPPSTAYQVKCKMTQWLTSGPVYDMVKQMMAAKVPIACRGVITMQVEEVYDLCPTVNSNKLAWSPWADVKLSLGM